ncbi:zinc-binding metallopeptidase family protein [Sulfuriflexus mobilis]|uniref:zinc-binding metallopeptidase family protein n=1 Tax=Sulfuriflexus mobilis TaxID=1811807 RepID=UPI000F81BEC0|nr:putative zinc-binding peptidase [Sulfuriflexus mobilis]
MRTFTCTCGNTLYFDNNLCLQCGKTLGFDPAQLTILPLLQGEGDDWQPDSGSALRFHKCGNYLAGHGCNWLIPAEEDEHFCLACRLNEVIPDLSKDENEQRWYKLESAKRRLIYTLLTLRLPITTYHQDKDHGLAFRFMEDIKGFDMFSEEMVTYEEIMTGHNAGTITINILEADDSEREKIRESMNEAYRTILGHFRHEIGHYYWDQFIARTERLDEFRALFGDERNDYKNALSQYYQYGAQANWQDNFISAYASSHPWEDWAESWAHYLHFMDVLETASHHHVGIQGDEIKYTQNNLRDWLEFHDFGSIIGQLVKLMRTLNELNRSLGFPDPYPFEHSPTVINKLGFIHRVVMSS